jgi:hypothetical protein
MLSDGAAQFARGNPRDACITARADLIVQRRLTSFDLVNVAVPYGFQPEAIGSVVAIGGAAHGEFAARLARKIAEATRTEAALICVSRDSRDQSAAQRILEMTEHRVPGLRTALMRADSATALLAALPADALLVVGATGGSWVQRQLLGPGSRLRHLAPGGVVVARSTTPRCFQQARPSLVVSPWLAVADARRLVIEAVVPVVDRGRLVGIVRRDVLRAAPDDTRVAAVAEEAVFMNVDDPIEAVADLSSFLEGAPVPLVDASGRYHGSIRTESASGSAEPMH